MRKDESIERTFKGVAKHFREVFSELVQGGHGILIMKKKKVGFITECYYFMVSYCWIHFFFGVIAFLVLSFIRILPVQYLMLFLCFLNFMMILLAWMLEFYELSKLLRIQFLWTRMKRNSKVRCKCVWGH